MIILDSVTPASGFDFMADPVAGNNRIVVQFEILYSDGTIIQDAFTGTDIIQDAFVEV